MIAAARVVLHAVALEMAELHVGQVVRSSSAQRDAVIHAWLSRPSAPEDSDFAAPELAFRDLAAAPIPLDQVGKGDPCVAEPELVRSAPLASRDDVALVLGVLVKPPSRSRGSTLDTA